MTFNRILCFNQLHFIIHFEMFLSSQTAAILAVYAVSGNRPNFGEIDYTLPSHLGVIYIIAASLANDNGKI
jgi:hypothetical protein